MIIKLQETANSLCYKIIDNASSIKYEIASRYYSGPQEFDEHMVHEQKETASSRIETRTYRENLPTANTSSIRLNFLRFSKDGADILLWFDGEAFICNDDGKTIQRIPAA